MTSARIKVVDLLSRLVEDKVVTKNDLVSLLGTSRHSVDVNTLEIALVEENVLSEDRLAEIVSQLSGRTMLDGSGYQVKDSIPVETASQYGALVVDAPELTVAFVEDTEENISGVCNYLGAPSVDVWLVTATAFARYRELLYSGRNYMDLPVARDIFQILDHAIDMDASDVHISVGVTPRVRASGVMRELQFRPLDRLWVREQVASLMPQALNPILESEKSADFAYTFGTARFRVNAAYDSRGHTLAMRKLPSEIPTPDEINLPEAIRQFTDYERGMVLVTGPTGSGKSTTLAALINDIVFNSSRHVITLEDPIEFRFPTNRRALVNQRELGTSFNSFSEGLRDALRQDPDVVLVGELRDADTIRTAVTAAETGHLVFGSLHTYDAPSTVMRLVNSFPANEQDAIRAQLSTLLRGVVSQTLVPRAGGKGRVAAHEVMVNTTAVASNLRKHDGHNQLKQTMQTAASEGMSTMEGSLARLVNSGQVTRSEAEFRARDRQEFQRMLEFYAQQGAKLRVNDL